MKRRADSTIVHILILLTLWSGIAVAGDGPAPFGLEWGMSPTEAEALGVKLMPSDKKDGAKNYEAKNVPKVLADMEHVFLDFGYSGKLWRVVAISKAFENDPYGSGVLARYDEILGLLQEKYGQGKSVRRKGDSIYAEPKHFLSGIQAGRSWHYTDFESAHVAVQLGLRARSSDTGYWVLIYQNRPLAQEYEKERKQQEKKSL